MSRKPSAKGTYTQKEYSFNQLVTQLEDPRSMLNLLPEDHRANALSIPDDWLNLDEDTILNKLKNEKNYTPTNTIECLRNNFWMEFERVQLTKSKNEMMNITNVYLGVCTREYWFKILNTDRHLFAYIMTKSPAYEAAMAGLLSLATRRIRDVLSLPIDPDGDPKLIELVLKAAAMVDLRNKGGYLNRSETKNLTMMKQETTHSYSHMFSATGRAKDAADSLLDIDEKLKALEAEIAGTPEPVVLSTQTVTTQTVEASDTIDAEYTEVPKRG